MVISASSFWWSESNQYDEFIESNIDVLFAAFEKDNTYEKYIDKVNEGIAIYNSVGGDKSKLSDQKRKDLDAILAAADTLKEEANELFNPKTRLLVNSRKEKYESARLLSVTAIFIGVLLTVIGFYLWYVRLQRYIDNTQRNA